MANDSSNVEAGAINSQSIAAVVNAEIIKKFGRKAGDTGSPEVQIALLTKRIETLAAHTKLYNKDFHSLRGLMRMVSKRKRLLSYLKNESPVKYKETLTALNLRK